MKNIYELLYKEAQKAYKKGEIPVGAIIVYNNKIVAKSHNDRQSKYSLIGHAEIRCILKAEKKLKDWRLDNCDIYVTLKPCEMCQYLIKESRINKVYYLLDNENSKEIANNIVQTNDCIEVTEKYKKLLNNFFKNMRK